MEDFPFDDNIIYIIPTNNIPIKVIFGDLINKEKKSDYPKVIKIDSNNNIDPEKWREIIEKLFPSNN